MMQILNSRGLDAIFIAYKKMSRILQFWPRQLLKKWLSFQETGDDFDRDSDSAAEEFSESEDFDDCDGTIFGGEMFLRFCNYFIWIPRTILEIFICEWFVFRPTATISRSHVKISLCYAPSGIEGSGDEDTRELTESDPDTDAISIAGWIHPQCAPLNWMVACMNCVLLSNFSFPERTF